MTTEEQKAPPPKLTRNPSVYEFEADPVTQSNHTWVTQQTSGREVLLHPEINKGLGFTWKERSDLQLHGLLPPVYRNLNFLSNQIMDHIRRIDNNLDKYMFIMSISETNEKLFFRTLCENLPDLMPIVYTPTVGLACQKFGYIFQRPRGMFLTIKDRGRVFQMLKNWPSNDIRAICVTDGERILGLGDLGICGMGIPIGKLALYTGCAGVRPDQLLPVVLDCGTNNESLLNDKYYIGLKQKRDKGENYDKFVDEFMRAVTARWGATTLIQFEDFGNSNAFRLLDKYRNSYCTFNDDIQGTASVALAGIFTSLRVKDAISDLTKHTFLMYGAGSAGIGIADLIAYGIHKESGDKISVEDARKQIWLVDSRGLIFKGRKSGGISKMKERYAHERKDTTELKDLEKIVLAVKATAMLGVSGRGKFPEGSVRALLKFNKRPLVCPMSNPTKNAECTAKQAYEWTNNQCIFASGSPFPKMNINNQEIIPGQGNNAYVFPGVALGIMACRASRVTDHMFYIAAKTLAAQVGEKMISQGTVYPGIDRLRECSTKIACAIVEECYRTGVATQIKPTSIEKLVNMSQYDHKHQRFYHDSCFDDLEETFGDN